MSKIDWPLCITCNRAPCTVAADQTERTGEPHVYLWCSVSCRNAWSQPRPLDEAHEIADALSFEDAAR